MTDEPQPRQYTAEEVQTLIALSRRALKRIAVLEQRVAELEQRQHDLDDLAPKDTLQHSRVHVAN